MAPKSNSKRVPSKETPVKSNLHLGGFATGGMVLLFVATGLSQFNLQVLNRAATMKRADDSKRFTQVRDDHAKRGAILARDNRILAEDEESYQLTIQFAKVPNSEPFFVALSTATGIPASEFSTLAEQKAQEKVALDQARIAKGDKPDKDPDAASWRQPVGGSQFEAVRQLRKEWRADGLSLKPVARRNYPLAEAASGIVGIVKEGEPLLGLERSQNDSLKGIDGRRAGLTDRRGSFLPMRMDEAKSRERTDGKSIQLTLDTELQMVAATAIRDSVKQFEADNGVALVMDPKTGDILAAANWPSYSPYSPDGGEASLVGNSGYNPAFMAQLEPGSTFKILTLAKGLDSGLIHEGDMVDCPGFYHPTPRTKIQCDSHHGNRAHGHISLDTAIAKSCNVAAATWAMKVGYTPFIDYVRDLGLLSRSNLGLLGEVHGNFNYKEPNHDLQLATVGFGQSVTCSPVGLLGAFGMLANHGYRMSPRLIKRVGNQDLPLAEGKQLVRPETAASVLRCMEAVIESDEGTGKVLRIPGYRLGGKTGTAQKVGEGRPKILNKLTGKMEPDPNAPTHKGEKRYVSNFIGFVPANEPKAVILVMVNNPKGHGYYGATVAGPVFKKLAQAVITRYGLPMTEPIRPMSSNRAIAKVEPTSTGAQIR